jgi:outer membrane protein assembly factor BamB/orotate phosphoribosyltransferase
MSKILFDLIQKEVFKQDEIKKISLDGEGVEKSWIFDFKATSLRADFLQEYSGSFWGAFTDISSIQIGGMEAGALALIASVSLGSKIHTNTFYIRKSRKKSDLANLIEGEMEKDIPIVLVDDILNSGSTFKKQILILEERGYKVMALFVCLRFRDMSYYKEITDKGIAVYSIFELNDFAKVLPVANLVNKEKIDTLKYTEKYSISLTNKPNLYVVVSKSAPLLIGDHLYVGVDGGYFYCLNKNDGSVVWVYKVMFGAGGKYILSSPAVYKDTVIFGAYDGNVYCLDRFTGKKKWVFVDADWVGSSPCIDESRGVVYIGLEFAIQGKQGGVVAIDIETGKEIWKNYSIKGYVHATPLYNKKYDLVFCGSNDHFMYAMDARSGEIVWRFEVGGDIKYGSVVDEERGLLIFGAFDGYLYIIKIKDGSLYHKFQAYAGFYSTPIIVEGTIVIGSLDKYVYCFDISIKQLVWKKSTLGRVFASPTLYGKSIFIGSNDGRLYELDYRTGVLITTTQFSERIVNKAQVEGVGDKIIVYVLTHTGSIVKLERDSI